jgi:hypothetical protein
MDTQFYGQRLFMHAYLLFIFRDDNEMELAPSLPLGHIYFHQILYI